MISIRSPDARHHLDIILLTYTCLVCMCHTATGNDVSSLKHHFPIRERLHMMVHNNSHIKMPVP